MPFQAAEVIFGSVPLPASVWLRHSYSIQPGSKSPSRQQVLPEREMPVGMVGLQAERAQQTGDGILAIVDIGEHQ